MGLDIRLPIGFLFAIFGVMLIAYGVLSDRQFISARSASISTSNGE